MSLEGCTNLKKVYLPDCTILEDQAFTFSDEGRPLPNLEEVSIPSFKGMIGRYFSATFFSASFYYTEDGYGCQKKPFRSGQNYEYYLFPPKIKIIVRNQKELDDYALWSTNSAMEALSPQIELCAPLEKIGSYALEESAVTKLVFSEKLRFDEDILCCYLEKLEHLDLKRVVNIPNGLLRPLKNLQKLELPFSGSGTKDATANFGELFGKDSRSDMRPVTQFFENGQSETYYIPTSLKEVVLAEGCEIIPYGCFYNCNMIETITLPTSLYMVGEKAFFGCAKMAHIYCKGAEPAVAYDNSFDGMRISSCKLHIPYNTTEIYKRSSGWEKFYYFEEEAPLYISVVKTIENGGVVYGLNEYQPGQTAELKAVANSGYIFKGWIENEQLLSSEATYSFTVTGSRDLVVWFEAVMDKNSITKEPTANGITFSYPHVSGAKSYRLNVYSDKSMTAIIGSTTQYETAEAKSKILMASVSENMRTISIGGLQPSTSYYYSVTAFNDNNNILSQFTGSFITKSESTGVYDIVTEQGTPQITGYYDLSGHRMNAPRKGVNIIRYSDGSARKVVIR